MKRFLTGLLLLILAVPSMAQDKPAPPKPAAVKHFTGRVAPKDLAALKARDVAKHGKHIQQLPKVTAPQWDCRTLGIVPPVRDQGQCGSCWDFSGSGMITSALIKAGYGKADGSFDVSEQYVLDCYQNGGCNGDDNTSVLIGCKASGIALDDYGPYQASAGRCKTYSGKLLKIADWGFCTNQGDGIAATDDIKTAMVTYGPIGCAVAAGGSDFWNNGTGTDTGTSSSIDHDVILVGWDDTHDNGDGSKGAWIMRNSWGTSWGNQGYGWVKYKADSLGTEAVWCTATSIAPAGTPVISSEVTAPAVVGTAFTYQITASNSPTSYNATGLPPGISCNVTTGYVSGTPTTSGSFTAQLTATNASGSGTAGLTITVTSTPVPPNPPNPPTPPTPGISTIVIGQDLPAGTYQIVPGGSVVINGDMSVRELLEALQKCKDQPPQKAVPKCCGQPTTSPGQAADIAKLTKELEAIRDQNLELRRAMDAIMKSLLDKKE